MHFILVGCGKVLPNQLIKRAIGETRLKYEEIYTVSIQIEACLNTRLLCPISANPYDLVSLTPGHFLIGEHLIAFLEADMQNIPVSRLGRYQHLQFMMQHFWKRCHVEYLHQLQQRTRGRGKIQILFSWDQWLF